MAPRRLEEGSTMSEALVPFLCVFLYLLTRYMRPEGPWQRVSKYKETTRCPPGQQRFSNTPHMTEILSPTTEGHTGVFLSTTPSKPPDKRKKVKI